MDQAFGDERIEAWLQGRGGLRARILTDGFLTAKDGGLERHGRLHRARSGDPDRRTERLAGRDLRSAAAAASQGRARFDLTSQEGTMTSATIPDGSTQESKRPVTPVRSTLREPEEGGRPPGEVSQPDQAPPAPDDGPDAAAAAEASHWFG